ncbi:V-type proton ATPase subunit H-like isoform X3 [Clavelina lepadiformis]|uniref:V-type proton ATPase subunit H n=1 Tax=Clavelina lepadiformis TaxID=159417 RepID=A0ABP0FVY9_CLALP
MSQVRNMSLGSDEIDENLIALAPVPTNKLQAQAIEVRAHRVNWQSYLQGQMIQAQDFEVIREFDLAKTPEARKEILDRRGDECARTFISLMTRISKEQTVRYVLTAVDDLLTEDRQRTQLFCDSNNKKRLSPWVGFMNMLNRTDRFIVHQASRIISKLACWSKERMSSHDLTYYLNWIKTQLSNEVTDFVQSILSCLQMMLRVKEYREAFFNMDGMTSLQSLLYTKCGFQLQYQTIFCIWLITFSPELCDRMVQYNSVPVLADILAEAAKEKVTRIILGTFRNLIDKPVENDTVKVFSQAMIHFKVLKQLEILEGKQFADEDITNDVEFLTEHLSNCLQDLSSFDEYVSEVKSRRLEWSPVHKSEKFWRENAARLNEKNYELLKILTSLMETSQDPDILAVATHDIGEYVRHYPRGKKVIDQLGLKQLVMQLLAHENAQVKYCALIAVQKLMVHNWEYLGKQLTSG